MITPRFSVTQTEEEIVLHIHAPYTDINAAEIHVDNEIVCFYSKPYYLRLHLPGSVQEDENAPASYDADKGDFIVRLVKAIQGQDFPNLDMVTSLLNPGKSGVNIEVLEGSSQPSLSLQDCDWFLDQSIQELSSLSLADAKYGFANCKSGVFTPIQSELGELLDLQNPDSTPIGERAELQTQHEDSKFCPEHYLADWAEEDSLIAPLLEYTASWPDSEEWSKEEQERLISLSKVDLVPLDHTESRIAMLNICELIFCWAHEMRCSLGDSGPESARSIRRLSAVLSWLRDFKSVRTLGVSCMRRALCVPLHRNWKLGLAVWRDTHDVIKSGKMSVVRILLQMLYMFSQCEDYHVLSKLYIEPYTLWLQRVPDQSFVSLAAALNKVELSKADCGWDLEQLEVAAKLVMEEETSGHLSSQLSTKLNITERHSDSDDSDDSESSSGEYSCSEEENEESEI